MLHYTYIPSNNKNTLMPGYISLRFLVVMIPKCLRRVLLFSAHNTTEDYLGEQNRKFYNTSVCAESNSTLLKNIILGNAIKHFRFRQPKNLPSMLYSNSRPPARKMRLAPTILRSLL